MAVTDFVMYVLDFLILYVYGNMIQAAVTKGYCLMAVSALMVGKSVKWLMRSSRKNILQLVKYGSEPT